MTKQFTLEKFTELEYGIKQDGETLIGISLDNITAKYIVEKWNKLADENEQLKERNNRQAKQLDNLYTLIEKQDWKTLKGIIQEFQECEEQIQQEWKCYE